MPTLICLQGHNSGAHLGIGVEREDNAVLREVHGDRDYGLRCMKEGFAALCYEQRAFGDRREQHMETSRGGCKDAAMHALMLGWSLMAERIWELGKATDWLLARDDIDAERFGLMGESGGGTTSIYAAALDERYRAIVPACAFCSFDGGILSIAHCTEFYFPGLRQQCEMGDILGLVAPRPAIVAAGTPDHFYPPESVESAFAHAERIYEAAGAGDQIHLKWGDQGHRFYADLTWPLLKAHWGLG